MVTALAALLAALAVAWPGLVAAAGTRPPGAAPSASRPALPEAGGHASRSRGIALNFDNADIATVVQAVSEIVGFNYVLAPDVRGTVTVRTAAPLGPEDVFAAFLSILEVHGFTAVRAGALWKIVRAETARERAIPTLVQ